MGQALYRTYRPRSLSEVVGQEHITETLVHALKAGKINHAYLFTGPRGVGKTSIARILAHEINGLPYSDDSEHLDIIEIDAASNRGIEDIRDIREKVHIMPTTAKYKVYIIDEVHMMTTPAFNALLKTLEEPPKHVVFILATTEAHKLPATIVSRTQRYSFKPVEQPTVVNHLRTIASKEGITISDEALESIAAHGEGSFRDSISLLDQASALGNDISLAMIQELMGTPADEAVRRLITLMNLGPASELLAFLDTLRDQGVNASALAKSILREIRHAMLESKPLLNAIDHRSLSADLLAVTGSGSPYVMLELALLGALPADLTTVEIRPAPVRAPQPPQIKNEREPTIAKVAPVKSKPELPPEPTEGELDDGMWNTILQTVKKDHHTLYTVLRMAKPEIGEDTFTLFCSFGFHLKQLSIVKNKKAIGDSIELIYGKPYEVLIVMADDAVAATTIPKVTLESENITKLTKESLDMVKDIFGGGELLGK